MEVTPPPPHRYPHRRRICLRRMFPRPSGPGAEAEAVAAAAVLLRWWRLKLARSSFLSLIHPLDVCRAVAGDPLVSS